MKWSYQLADVVAMHLPVFWTHPTGPLPSLATSQQALRDKLPPDLPPGPPSRPGGALPPRSENHDAGGSVVISPPVTTGCMTHPLASCPKLWLTSKSTSTIFSGAMSSSALLAMVTLSPDSAKLDAWSRPVASPPH